MLETAFRAEDRFELGRLIAHQIARLIGADSASYNELPIRGTPFVVRDQPVTVHDGAAIFGRYYKQHPIILHHYQTGDLTAHRLSDFLNRRQLHRLALYNEYYRPAGIEHQLSISIHNSASSDIAVALNRSPGKDFTGHDRVMLTAIGPLLTRAYDNVVLISSLREQHGLIDAGLHAMGRAIVALGPSGRITTTTTLAESWMRRYFDWRGGRGLPPAIARWLRAIRTEVPGDTMLVQRPDATLGITVLRDPRGTMLLLFREDRYGFAFGLLEAHGLSRREVEVLGWVAEGKTSPEIATILGVSVRTVHHHLDSIFRKLDVGTRTAAVRRAREIVAAR